MAAFLLVSLAPAAALLSYIYLRDAYEPEPRALVARVYFTGALLVLIAGLVESAVSLLVPTNPVVESFIVVGLTEELLKLLASLVVFYRNPHFNEEMDGVVYCSALALGFASAENILYVLVQGIPTGLLRALLPVPGHALFAVVMGYYLAKARFGTGAQQTQSMVRALFVPAVLHGAFNYFMMSDSRLVTLVVLLMVYLWWTGFRKMRSAEDSSPFKRRGLLQDREVGGN